VPLLAAPCVSTWSFTHSYRLKLNGLKLKLNGLKLKLSELKLKTRGCAKKFIG